MRVLPALMCLRGTGLRLLAALLLWATLGLPLHAAEPVRERLQVTDPYIELRTGPGRGYPIFFVASRSEWIEVELRHTDWYKVRTEGDKVGWVHRRQLETTLTEAGGTKTFRDLMLDDYLRRKVQFGVGWGRFEGEPMLKLWTGWRMSDSLSIESDVGQVQGLYSGSHFWHVDLVAEPWSDRRLSPFFSVGFGRFRNVPQLSLVGAVPTDAKLAHAALGLRWHLSERFVLHTDYSLHTAFVADTRSSEFKAWTAGLAFFF
jgi:hypothetical protein